MGYVNAVQEMILYSADGKVSLLPALPDNMHCGKIRNWRFIGGNIDMDWDIDKNYFKGKLKILCCTRINITLPDIFTNYSVYINNCQCDVKDHNVITDVQKNDKIIISNTM